MRGKLPRAMSLPRTAGLLLLAASSAHASGLGVSFQDCNACHSGGETPTVAVQPAATTVAPGALVPVVVEVGAVGNQVRAGFALRASGGLLAPAEPGVRLVGTDATHLQPRTAVSGTARFTVQWTAPLTPGTWTLNAWGNAADGVAGASGDRAAQAMATVRVGSPGEVMDGGTEPGAGDAGTGNTGNTGGSSGTQGIGFGTAPPPPDEPKTGCTAAGGGSLGLLAALSWGWALARPRPVFSRRTRKRLASPAP